MGVPDFGPALMVLAVLAIIGLVALVGAGGWGFWWLIHNVSITIV